MNRTLRTALATAALAAAGGAQAQDGGLTVSVGARAWFTQWTTFSYYTDNAGNNLALVQSSADDRLVLVPLVSVRYGDWVGSLSVLPSTRYTFADGQSGTRREVDVNLGYSVLPGLNVTLGYKKFSQRSGIYRYEPAGPTLGLSGNAPLPGGFSLYGTFGYGRLKTPQSGGPEVVKFKADYRLTEVGLAYSLAGLPAPRWTFTGGYRMQVMGSREAFGTQDGRDTTQGLTFGAVATF